MWQDNDKHSCDGENASISDYNPKHMELHPAPQKTQDGALQGKYEHDAVNRPDHYTQGGIECIDAIKAAVTRLTGIEAVCTANVIKYMWRWKDKVGVESLKKARWYLDRLIGEVEK